LFSEGPPTRISLQPQHRSPTLLDHLGDLVRRGEKRLWRRKRLAPSIKARDMGTTGFEADMAPNELSATFFRSQFNNNRRMNDALIRDCYILWILASVALPLIGVYAANPGT
jgi:hypothetical protein